MQHHKRIATTRLVRSIHFNRSHFTGAALHQYLSLVAHLTHVDLGNNRTISDHGLCESLSHLCLLTSLNVESTQATDDTLRIIAGSSQGLQCLNVLMCRSISDVGVGHLQLLPHLQHLDLRWCVDVTSDGLYMIASSLHHLQHLDVSNCPNVTDAGVEHLVTSSSLSSTIRYLGLSECKLISSDGLNRVASLSQLCCLQIAGLTNVTDGVLVHLLGTLQHLTQLDIGSCESITTAGLSSAALLLVDRPLQNLTKLDLGWWQQLTDEGLGSIVSLCPNLVALHLPYCENLTDDGIAHIASLHDLQFLDVGSCKKITNTSMNTIALLPQIRHVDLSFCDGVTDDGVQCLASSLHCLALLDIGWCSRVSDDSLEAIASSLPLLEDLNVCGCGMTREAINAFATSSGGRINIQR